MKKAGKGWVATPKPITGDTAHSIPRSPRFAIEEQHGNATKKKIRLVVDFERSEVDALLKLRDDSVSTLSIPRSRRLGGFSYHGTM